MYEDRRNLYQKLDDLKEGRKVIQSAIHSNFYNRTICSGLYDKLEKVNKEIAKIRYQIKKEQQKK